MEELMLVVALFGIGTLLRNQRKYKDELEKLKGEYSRGFKDGQDSVLKKLTSDQNDDNEVE